MLVLLAKQRDQADKLDSLSDCFADDGHGDSLLANETNRFLSVGSSGGSFDFLTLALLEADPEAPIQVRVV